MIDLHLHTKYSDGRDSVIELLQELKRNKINVISITDHDTAEAYDEIESLDINKYFTGEIITGMEMTTSFKGNRIEILAYGFKNHKKVSEEIKRMNDVDWNPILLNFRIDLLRKLDELGLTYDESFKETETMLNLYKYEVKLYESLKENNLNLKQILKEDYCAEDESFFRKCIANSKSKFYCNYYQFRPSLESVVNLIHDNEGVCFYAHPFGYNIEEPIIFAQELFDYCNENNCNLDGVEVYYFDFDEDKVKILEDFADKNGLYKSGGSDCHGYKFDPVFKLGKCLKGNQDIEGLLVGNWIEDMSKYKSN